MHACRIKVADAAAGGGYREVAAYDGLLFKHMKLVSIPDAEVVHLLTSRGTFGQTPSRIYLGRETAGHQAKALLRITRTLLGRKRCPTVIVDTEEVLRGPFKSSARVAGILGFGKLGRDHFHLLDDQMPLRWDKLSSFLEKHRDSRIFFLGSTFMIWQHIVLAARDDGRQFDVMDAVLIHGGGGKKLVDQAVGPQDFAPALTKRFGIQTVRNDYGMVEPVGSIHS